jgi:molybdopterin/thiamine biosynthesis adenylyltransferase
MPGHDQGRLEAAHVVIAGAGGLGSWIGVGLARMGVSQLTFIDHDRFDRTNAPRQMMFGADIGEWKAHALARNVVPHMTNPGVVTGIALPLIGGFSMTEHWPTVLVVAVDNNSTRLFAEIWCHGHKIPVVFPMLSRDGMRTQVVSQFPGGPCLSCMLPNAKAKVTAPCASAAVTSCMLAASHAVTAVADTIMGSASTPTWRESSLDGSTERASRPARRRGCFNCGSRSVA